MAPHSTLYTGLPGFSKLVANYIAVLSDFNTGIKETICLLFL
jgi:hypothetical protein